MRYPSSSFPAALVLVLACNGDGRDMEFESAGDAADGDSQTTGLTGASGGTGDAGDDGEPKFDVPEGESDGPGSDDGGSGCGCGNDDWSYIWVANSAENTVSKINTRTLVEEGRYLTRPDAQGSPSRTSVTIDGRAVAIANRHGGVTKIWAQTKHCTDQNGVAGIQTSTGPTDVLPWGDDDCIDWYAEFDDMSVQRPVQWTPGELNPSTCEYDDQRVWTATGSDGSKGFCNSGGVWVHSLNGASGEIEDTISMPDVACAPGGIVNNLGPYGGAVDAEGNFWFHVFGGNTLVRVDAVTLNYEKFTMPHWGYGILVDNAGKVWVNRSFTVGKISRFDYDNNSWLSADVGGKGGLAQDLEGQIWTADGPNGVTSVDQNTLAVGQTVAITGNNAVKGVSVDIDGFVWAIRKGQDTAWRIDPGDLSLDSYVGLNKPYSYSDMTGGLINNVTCNPAPEG